jgi:DNA-binding transcriptional LysR family regulator
MQSTKARSRGGADVTQRRNQHSLRVDLLTLRLFVAVYEEQGLAKAAARENLAASAISKRLADLEQMLQVRLFLRKRTGMYATPAGQALIHHARMIMRNVAQLESELVDYSEGMRGNIRVFANTSAMVQYLPDDLRSFLSRHPLVRVDIEEATSPVTLRAVAENNAEIGIFGDVIQAPGLHAVPYRRERLALLVPRDHPLAERTSVRFADALAYEFVGTPRGSSIDMAIIKAASDLGVPLRLRIRASGFEAIGHMVDAGLGIALIPAPIAQIYATTRNVAMVTLKEPWATRKLMLCVRSIEALPPAAAAFVEHLTRHESGRRAGAP